MTETNNAKTSSVPVRNLIKGTNNPDIIFGTSGNDEIRALEGNDTIIGTKGNDLIDGGSGFDTVDYSDLGQPITLLPRGGIGQGNSSGGQILNIEKIIGPRGQKNTIDGSGGGPASFNINLGTNTLIVNNIPNQGPLKFVVENFVNVIGTANGDTIVGSNADNTLDGSGGNDSIFGGLGNDTLIGGDGNDTLQGSTNTGKKGSPEKDVLTGSAGVDKFILGDASGSFYKNALKRDFAQITDFSPGEQIQLGAGDTYNIEKNQSGFNISVVKGNVLDLIAQVTITTGSKGIRTATAGLPDTAADPILDSLPEGKFTLGSGQNKSIFRGA
jgi:Ca2+-binding RTX toxin-like protein